MKIALCVKQVPDTSDIKWTENNTMLRDGVESILNPCDACALEEALKLKQKYDAEIYVFTMGPSQAIGMLKKIIALGADYAYLISDKKFAGADTYATGKTLSTSIKKILPEFDIILCGQFAIDGDTAQTGPCIAEFLNIPQVTYTKSIINIKNSVVTAQRTLDIGEETVEVKTPVLFCISENNIELQRPLINGIIKAENTKINILTFDNLELNNDEVGLKGSPTYVSKAFKFETKHNCVKHEENTVEILLDTLRKNGVIK